MSGQSHSEEKKGKKVFDNEGKGRPGPRLLFVAGGTGGHLFPALAVADKCRELAPDASVRFVGAKGRMEEEIVPRHGYPLDLLWISGFNRKLSLQNALLPMKILRSLAQARHIIRDFRPDVVICAGAYVSYPVGSVATMRKVPLVLMESNALPGRVVRKLAPKATEVHVAFEETKRYLPDANLMVSGNPVRKAFSQKIDKREARRHFGLDPDRPTLFAVGGSQGARSINAALDGIGERLLAEGMQLIWQTGKSYPGGERQEPNLYRARFLHDIDQAYAAADLVIARAGAMTITELRALGKAAVLVPLATAADDHQRVNAQAVEREGAGVMILDSDLDRLLYKKIIALLADPEGLRRMGEQARSLAAYDADETIARRILAIAQRGGER